MAQKYQRPKGTRDLLPKDLARWHEVEEIARLTAEVYGYSEIRTPFFEPVDLFARTIGASTDIVEKEMYAFETAGGDKFALRPEGTAGICRAYLEAGMHKSAPFQKFWYSGPMFRHDKPQKGRYREFRQFGVEAIGSDDPWLDVEVIKLGARTIERAGVEDLRTKLNSIGCMEPECRPAYREKLKGYFEEKKDELCGDCRRRIKTNVLRVLDCKVPPCKEVAAGAPKPADHLCDACAEHFGKVKQGLDALELPYEVDHMIVRGLDYYTRTVFEYFVEGSEGSQDALGAGGRYDGLMEIIGGPRVPAIGWALGLDRIVETVGQAGAAPTGAAVHVAPLSAEEVSPAMVMTAILREAGMRTHFDYGGKSFKARMRSAGRSDAKYVIILATDELSRGVVAVKEMSTGKQTEVEFDDLFDWLRETVDASRVTVPQGLEGYVIKQMSKQRQDEFRGALDGLARRSRKKDGER